MNFSLCANMAGSAELYINYFSWWITYCMYFVQNLGSG